MKGNLEMTEPVRLWSGENGSRAAHDWAARPRPPAEAPSPEQAPSRRTAGDARPACHRAEGCAQAQPGRSPPRCSWGAAWWWAT